MNVLVEGTGRSVPSTPLQASPQECRSNTEDAPSQNIEGMFNLEYYFILLYYHILLCYCSADTKYSY